MSIFVFYIFVSAIVLVQCQEFDHKEHGPHAMTEVADCKAAVKDIRKNRLAASPMPRERHVSLIPQQGFEFNPRTVSVKRCNGFCKGRWSPMPTKIMDKHFIVHLHTEGNSMPDKCVNVTVQEHVMCRCMCMKSAKDCKSSQMWVEHSCSCDCKDRDDKKSKCKEHYGMVWFDEDCSCKCTDKIMTCPSGMKWAKEYCSCVKK